MKRVLIGGFLSLTAAIGFHAIFSVAANNIVSSWTTPPGRLLTTISELGMRMPLFTVSVLLLFGVLIMLNEFRSKD